MIIQRAGTLLLYRLSGITMKSSYSIGYISEFPVVKCVIIWMLKSLMLSFIPQVFGMTQQRLSLVYLILLYVS